jgi:hypothetical protein
MTLDESRTHADSPPSPDTDEVNANALEILCRVFDDGADVAMEEWYAWYNPDEWWHWSRALGAFIRLRLDTVAKAQDHGVTETASLRGNV